MRRLFLFTVMVLLFSLTVQAQDSTPLFTPLSDTAVVVHGSTAWEHNYTYTDPGAVIYYDGMFHMFRNAFLGWPAAVQIDYMTSPDAITWTEMSDKPVLTTEDVPFAKVAALASSVVVEEDGTWVLYFYTWNTKGGNKSNSEIGRATASDPLGPWTVDPEPVLKAGSRNSWDEQAVNAPAVRQTDSGYVMYYTGFDKKGYLSGKIGMATSDDGITWTKYNNESTEQASLAESDPVLSKSETWEGNFISQPRVEHTDDGWVMLYRGTGVGATDMTIGLATSEDGIQWTKYANNPVFVPADVPKQVAMWYTSTTYHDGTYYLFTELTATASSSYTDIFTTKYEGSLPPAG